MTGENLYVVVPGDINTRTGGYEYDRQIVEGLGSRGWCVSVVSLPGRYPCPTDAERATAADLLAAIPADAAVLVDGLAMGALPSEMHAERSRLKLLALVHHPLGLETGLAADVAARLLESEREALQSARGVVVTSRRTVEVVRRLGVAPDRVVAVAPGNESKPVAAGSNAAGSTSQPNLLCVASLTPRKGHDTLLDAVARITDLGWHLVCVGGVHGDPAYAQLIQNRSAAAPLAGRVTFRGELSGPMLDAAYDASDLFVLPTRYEGYGMAVAEALGRGIPVISTPTGGIRELVGDTAGFLVSPDDSAALAGVIRLFLTDRTVRAGVRRGALRARDRLQTWGAASRQMEEAIVQLLA